ncbi:MAG: ornithine aminomutase subunit alpha [Tenericutes bacterium]|nr:ornithine aminomutase subunit alpha [Mycoplasmatota bacterium]
MDKHNTRTDDFEKRRKHLIKLSDEELKQKFWDLADQATEPLIILAKKNTSPAIERSVLLRMGFSSLEANDLVKLVINHNLIRKGAGHVVYRYSQLKNKSIRESGIDLINNLGWDEVMSSFGVSL